MNLVAKEFVASRDDETGVLILSQFAGASGELDDAIIVNPYDTEGTADAIHSALVMPLDERCARHERLLAEVRRHDVHWWRKSFLDALKEATT